MSLNPQKMFNDKFGSPEQQNEEGFRQVFPNTVSHKKQIESLCKEVDLSKLGSSVNISTQEEGKEVPATAYTIHVPTVKGVEKWTFCKMTAYHEAGHALMMLESPHSDPLHKVTIIPRGRALGVTMSLPTDDKDSRSYIYLKERMAICFGGRVAEEMIFGEDQVSTGASQDIRVATNIARNMVTQWGMNKEIGPIAIEEPDGEVFLGYSISQRKNVSEELAAKVDHEIKMLVEEAYASCRRILAEKRDVLEAIAQGLLEYETLTAEEVKALLNGEKLTREEPGVHISARSTVPVTDPAPQKEENETKPDENKKGADSDNETPAP